MAGARRDAAAAQRSVSERLVEARRGLRQAGRAPGPSATSGALAALQRSAGNAAVSALLAGRIRSQGSEAVAGIDAALKEIRRDEPNVETVETGLKAAKAAGVPVDIDGAANKPPPSALAVATTGFGLGSVAGKKPVPPVKPTPAKSPLAKTVRSPKKPRGGGAGGRGGPKGARAKPSSAPAGRPGGAVANLLEPPVAPTPVGPAEDPGFTHVTASVKGYAADKRTHAPPAVKAQEAQDAAVAPAGDIDSQAKAAKVDSMDAQPAGSFDKKAFIAAVKAAIEAKSPKSLEEADEYKDSGKAGEVKDEVKDLVSGGKDASAKDIETATEAPPDQAKAVPKQVAPLPPEQPGQPQATPAAAAVPKPAPPEQLNLEAGKHEANQTLADAEVSETQLAESNEPDFQGALAAKQDAAQHSAAAPGEFRQAEQTTIGQAKSDANEQTAASMTGMHSAKVGALSKVMGQKAQTKTKDEAKRAEVTTRIQAIFGTTETAVKKILDEIDPKVEQAFEQGEKGARSAFERLVATKMSAYKKDRYGGWLGGLKWAKDKLFGMPSKVNEFFEAGRELYLSEMDKVISRVADIVAVDLTAAKSRIAAGRTEIAAYVKSLPEDLKKVGGEAAQEVGEQFAQLESDVNSKQDALVDSLASKYVEARKGLDDRIEALQAENKGLVDKAIGAIKAVINTIRELAAMLKNVLARAAGVVGDIIKSPVAFLGNLIDGVKGGILRFKENIENHLRAGLMSWLFGTLAKGGIELPDSFDIKGIIKLLAQIFGLTWANIRNRLVRAVGDKAVSLIERSVNIFAVLADQGVAGLWEMIVEKVGDIKETIMEKVKDYVQDRIITAGITWLIGLLNPAAAFIKACKLIYDVVMFFVQNAGRIAQFVNTVLDSVSDIARGAVGGVMEKIENVLSQMLPILIGFLASLVNLGGVGKKIREIVETLQRPVNKAVDAVIAAGLKLAAPLIRGVKGIGAKAKAKIAQGKAYVKGKVLGGDDSAEGKQKRLEKGVRGGVSAANRFAGKSVGRHVVRPVLSAVRLRYGLSNLEPVKQGGYWAIHGVVSRMTEPTKVEVAVDDERLTEARRLRQAASNEWTQTKNALKPMARKLKGPKSPLGPAERARAQAAEADFNTREATYVTNRDRLDEIQDNRKEQPGEVAGLITFFTDAALQFARLRRDIELVSADPSKIEAEAKKLLGEVHGQAAKAESLVADPDVVRHVFQNPVQRELADRINARRKAIKDGLAALPKNIATIADLEEVRTLKETANGLQNDAVEADRLKVLLTQVQDHAAAIDKIIEQTTIAGRPGATEGAGSSEDAVVTEVATGRPVKDKWHGIKCTDDARGLRNAIAALTTLSALPTAAPILGDINAAIQRAQGRLPGLESGAAMWDRRATSHPTVWMPDGSPRRADRT